MRFFAEGQWPSRKIPARKIPPPGRQREQGSRVLFLYLVAQLFEDRLVAGHLHIPAAQPEGEPDEGVEPVQAEGREADQPDDVVAAADVGLLVEEDAGLLPLRKPGRQIDARPENAEHKGGLQPRHDADPLLRGVRFGRAELFPQPQVGDDAPAEQQRHAGKPDHAADRRHLLHRPRRDGDALVVTASQVVVDRDVDRGDAGFNAEGVPHRRAGRDGGGAGDDARRTLKGEGAEQPEQRHRPEQVGKGLRRFFQAETHRENQQDDQPGSHAHVQKGEKNCIKFHEYHSLYSSMSFFSASTSS